MPSLKTGVKWLTPPIIYDSLRRLLADKISGLSPSWQIITAGRLKGRKIFLDPAAGDWAQRMIAGNYDDYFDAYLDRFDLTGKTVLDVGAHIGYLTLNFAQRVGTKGSVIAFEPNPYNRRRLHLIVEANPDLASRITISELALSDREGETEIFASSNIDTGKSSGSFIAGSDTPSEISAYMEGGFKAHPVRTSTLDVLRASKLPGKAIALLKIDVEGAENMVLRGGESLFSQDRPVLLIEVHTILNMFQLHEFALLRHYEIKMLAVEEDGRCFIAAEPLPVLAGRGF